ncbi:hypothetical protein Cni_G19828 [Canna indica]|uniref:Uncharacterized protein n=1 Tax=Canna indica TaxID=4628 RepID=A0AAQ3KLB2_9LILI|nr:hypothetical protein Cni_G19828 [Canna indica]
MTSKEMFLEAKVCTFDFLSDIVVLNSIQPVLSGLPIGALLGFKLKLHEQVFTNVDKAHAAKVLKRLGLEDCFEGVICFEALNQPPPDTDTRKRIGSSKILCKSSLEAFQAAIRIANIDPKRIVIRDLLFLLINDTYKDMY